jgi:hypothetical protein
LETERSQLVRDLESTEAEEGQSSRVCPRSHGQETMNVRARCHVGASIHNLVAGFAQILQPLKMYPDVPDNFVGPKMLIQIENLLYMFL